MIDPHDDYCFTVTTGADYVDAIGSTNTINGLLANNGTSNTWQSWDTIRGGTGTDTLTTELNGGTGVMSNVSSVENLNLNVTGAQVIDATGLAGIAAITATANNTLAINNLGSLPAVSLSNTNTTTLNMLNSALAGSADTLTLNLVGGQTGAVTVTDTAGSNTLETIAVNSTGTNTIATLTASGLDATTLDIGGSGQLTITTLTDDQATIELRLKNEPTSHQIVCYSVGVPFFTG